MGSRSRKSKSNSGSFQLVLLASQSKDSTHRCSPSPFTFALFLGVGQNKLDDLLALLLVLRLDLLFLRDRIEDVPETDLLFGRGLGVLQDLVAVLLEVGGIESGVLGTLRELLSDETLWGQDIACLEGPVSAILGEERA